MATNCILQENTFFGLGEHTKLIPLHDSGSPGQVLSEEVPEVKNLP